MRTTFLAIACLALCGIAFADTDTERFIQFIKDHDKSYTSIEELQLRFTYFQQSLARIHELGDDTFGVNKFSDLSPEEFKGHYLNNAAKYKVQEGIPVMKATETAPNTVIDWRKKGAVTPVKNQAQCGSCWAFSATEEIESMNILKTGETKILSPQQIVSCDGTSFGCNGGWPYSAYNYVKQAGGIESNKDYPYTSQNGASGTCKFNSSDVDVKVSGYTYAVPACTDDNNCNDQNVKLLNNNMAQHGPVSICVNAGIWQDYTNGILKAPCANGADDLDHCVQLVGSNMAAETPYWIIRNSWATDWGVDGYIYVAVKDNLCGVADQATFATIA